MNRKQNDIIGINCFKCNNCKNVTFSYKKICHKCGSTDIEQIMSEGKGKIVDFTTVYHPPENYKDMAPYTIVLTQLNSGCKFFGILKGEAKDVKLDSPINVVKFNEDIGSFILELVAVEK